MSYVTQEATLHYGWAVPAAGNTKPGEKAVPQKYLEIEKFCRQGKTGLIEKSVSQVKILTAYMLFSLRLLTFL